MVAIFQTTFSNTFSWMKMEEFRLRFHWSLFLRVQLTTVQHWFRQRFDTGQVTSHCLNQWWLIYRCIYASLGINELNHSYPRNFEESMSIFVVSVPLLLMAFSRGVTIQVPHDTIRISIQRSRYNTYLDTYLNTVRCQRDVMSSMKAETPVIRSPAHNLLLQWTGGWSTYYYNCRCWAKTWLCWLY